MIFLDWIAGHACTQLFQEGQAILKLGMALHSSGSVSHVTTHKLRMAVPQNKPYTTKTTKPTLHSLTFTL